MLRIISHIERLLLVHDCVIVPKFGGFVLQSIPAQQVEMYTFRPSRKELRFNVTLQHNDGLLSESYMQMYAVNYTQAQLMLEEDVAEMKGKLYLYKKISMGALGSFRIGEEGQLIFQPSSTDLFSVETYGLPTFYFPTLASLETKKCEEETLLMAPEDKKDIFYIPVSRKLIRAVVASAASVALFLLVSTPVKDVNKEVYTASFVPTEVVLPVMDKANISVEKDTFIVDDKVEVKKNIVAREVKKETPMPVSAKKLTVKTSTKKNVSTKKEIVNQSKPKIYHIVIASFPNESQADEFVAKVDRRECKNVSKVVRDGKYRIYADKFNNRKEAEAYMTNLRANPKYKDAWLYICR
jgi:hypothetical protein